MHDVPLPVIARITVTKQSRYGRRAHAAVYLSALALAAVSACTSSPRPGTPGGSSHTVRLQLPPDQAAACFARNAEEHSSALTAQVRREADRAEVVVRVKNGVLYGTADFQRAGAGSRATIALNVMTRGRLGDLVDALTEGC